MSRATTSRRSSLPVAERVRSRAAAHERAMTAFCRRLIRTPSLSGQEQAAVELVAREMEKARFDQVRIDRLGNVLGRVGSGRTKILIDAHLDTVGVGDRASWRHDPFHGKFEKGKIYGRGAADQKAAMAAMLGAGRLIGELGLEGDYQLWFVGSCQEEDCDGVALLHLIEREKLRPDFAVITEPTRLALHRGQRGRAELEVVTRGRSAHASEPARGDNAICKMAPLVTAIERMNGSLSSDELLGPGSIAVTRIECETVSNNAIPDRCSIVLDRRLTAGETRESALAELRALPEFATAEAEVHVLQYAARSWKGLAVQQEKVYPGWVLPAEHLLVRAGLEAGRLALGRRPRLGHWAASTNGVATMGRHGIPTIGFGPADVALAHTPDEFVAVDELVKAATFYALLGPVLAEMLSVER